MGSQIYLEFFRSLETHLSPMKMNFPLAASTASTLVLCESKVVEALAPTEGSLMGLHSPNM
ncbi:hypothetical protein D3C81_2237120 [compost metagenome]